MVRAKSHLENYKNFRGRNCLYLAGRLRQRIEVSAVTSCPYQRAHIRGLSAKRSSFHSWPTVRLLIELILSCDFYRLISVLKSRFNSNY